MDAKLRCDEDGYMNLKSQDLEEIYPTEKVNAGRGGAERRGSGTEDAVWLSERVDLIPLGTPASS